MNVGRYKSFRIVLWLLLSGSILNAQNYQALHGSPYAGALGSEINPASIVQIPFSWDFSPFAIQAKHSTNAIRVHQFSLLSPRNNPAVGAVNGKKERYLLSGQDIRLFQGRFRLNERSAFTFGVSLRSGISAKTSSYNWQDTISGVRDFMSANLSNIPLSAEMRGMAWAEISGGYARTILDNGNGLLQAGIGLTVNRGLAGAYLSAEEIYFTPGRVHNENGYLLRDGRVEYAYSSNLDEWDNPGSGVEKRKRFFRQTWSSLSLNLGAEYMIPSASDETPYGYDLKIGLSVLDLGSVKFGYSSNSRQARLNGSDVYDSLIQASFEDLGSADALPDSMAVISGSISAMPGYFRISKPARVVISADKRISGSFFVNAELSIPLSPVLSSGKLFLRDLNLAALTPRYETRIFGFYLPAVLTTRMQFWVGGAVRLGPLWMGVHNLGNLFSGDKIHQGGAYLAMIFRPGKRSTQESGSFKNRSWKERPGRKGDRLGCPANVR